MAEGTKFKFLIDEQGIWAHYIIIMNFTNSFYEDGGIMVKTMTTLTRTLEKKKT